LEGKDNQKGPVGDSLAGRVYGFRFVVYGLCNHRKYT